MDQAELTAFLFDLDGVIVSSEPHWVRTESGFISGLLPSWDAERQKTLLGLSVRDVYRLLSDEHGLKIGWLEFLDYYDRVAGPIYTEKADEVEGVESLMRRLAAAGYPLAIISNSPRRWIDLVITRFDLSGILSCVVSSEDITTPGKPHPGIYLHGLNRLGIEPGDAVAVEDSRKGIESSKAAGIKTVGLLNGYNTRSHLAAADLIVDGFNDPWWREF